MSQICPACGKTTTDGDKCIACGADLSESSGQRFEPREGTIVIQGGHVGSFPWEENFEEVDEQEVHIDDIVEELEELDDEVE